MPKYSIEKETLDAIADAINEKTGGTAALAPPDMPAQIASIGSGIDTSDATAGAADILAGKTAYAGGKKITGTIAEKSADDVTASGAAVTVPAGHYASDVTRSVATATQATPSISVSSGGLITASATQSAGYVSAGTKSATTQLSVQGAQTITPTTADQTIAAGKYLTGAQTVKGDSNLAAGNIKSGVSIFGVTGTYSGGSATVYSITAVILGETYTIEIVQFRGADNVLYQILHRVAKTTETATVTIDESNPSKVQTAAATSVSNPGSFTGTASYTFYGEEETTDNGDEGYGSAKIAYTLQINGSAVTLSYYMYIDITGDCSVSYDPEQTIPSVNYRNSAIKQV